MTASVEISDGDLLAQYASQRSEEAFSVLVSRHINMVYSVALRHVSNHHQAEEITQAVFLILARKASSLKSGSILAGWLFHTARLTAANFVRSENRRLRRDQEAYMQSTLSEDSNETQSEVWQQIAPTLDAAIAELSEKDRNAIVLRFVNGMDYSQVGTALGATAQTAQVRVSRAVEKLRRIFSKHGFVLSASVLTSAIASSSVQAAPVGLAASISASTVKGATLTLSTLSLVKGTLNIMAWTKIKSAALVTVGVAMVGVTLTIALGQAPAKPPSVAAQKSALPIKFANDSFAAGVDPARYFAGTDPKTKRTAKSAPAGHIKSLVPAATVAEFLASQNGRGPALRGMRSNHLDINQDSPLLGKRIRVSGWLKTRDVANWAGTGFLLKNSAGRLFAVDDMTDRPIHGTTDWKQITIVCDVPKESCMIDFGVALYGTGEVWADDFQIDIAPPNTPITDDQLWHKWSPNSPDYKVALDPDNQRDGHPTLCMNYTPDGIAPPGSWMWWGQCIRPPEQYAGHMVRMTAWVKTEEATGRSTINLRPKGPNFQLLESKGLVRRITGTTDWTEYSIICRIPKETQCLDTGLAFNGGGKLWLDTQALQYEILDDGEPQAEQEPAKP